MGPPKLAHTGCHVRHGEPSKAISVGDVQLIVVDHLLHDRLKHSFSHN